MPELMRPDLDKTGNAVTARRKFLAVCGKFAVATPPAIALLLAASERNYANALSGGGHGGGHHHHHHHRHRHGNNGFGNGGHDGVPGHSRHSDWDR